MKFKYDMNEGYSKIYNESMGIYKDRLIIKKRPNYRLKSYLYTHYRSLILYVLVILMSLYMIFIKKENIVFWVIATIVMSLFLITLIVILVKQFKGIKQMDHSGEMEFTEKGIWDISKHSKFFWKWELVDYVVIGKYAYTFVMKEYPYLFSLPVSLEKDINKSLKKLKIKIDIIDKRK